MTTANTNLVAHAIATTTTAAAEMFLTAAAFAAFVVAGKARFTVMNTDTSTRFTYRVNLKKSADFGFVSVFTGTDNTSRHHYDYIGYVRRGHDGAWTFTHGRKSAWGADDVRVRAFAWLFRRAMAGVALPSQVKVWHEGSCGRCARTLTSEYRLIGIGPVCCGHVDLDPIKAFAALPVNEAIVAARSALADGRKGDARKIAAAHKDPMVAEYVEAHLAAA